jgi:signal transduction histidine kinase
VAGMKINKLHLRWNKLTGLKRRWVLNNVSALLAIVILSVGMFAMVFSSYYYSNIQSALEAKAKTTTDFFGNYINQSYNQYYQSCIKYAENFEDKNSLELQFINTRETIIASSYGQWAGTTPGTEDITEALSTGETAVFSGKAPATGERIMSVSTPMVYSNGEIIGVLRIVTSLRVVDRQIIMGVVLVLLVGVLIVALVLFNSKYFIRSIVEPVTEITATAKRIAAGSYGVQIKKKFDDEIGELADTINDMSLQISQSEKMQTEFISSVSHELRTPLTAIAGWGETLLDGNNLDQETRRGITTILRETQRLTRMVEELLEFTRIQDGRFKLSVEPCDIRAEFEDTVFMYGSRLRQEGIELEYEENDDDIPEISCDPARMRQVFLNILDNAAKHGGEGRRIVASMTLEDGAVVTRIRDFGPGIPEEELPHIKLKFYKGSSKARGSGIGLAVCEEIVTMHNGTLTIENAPGGGALVTISLPVS